MGDHIINWTWSKPGESLLKSPKIVKEDIQEEKEEEEEKFIKQNKRELSYNKIAARRLMTKGNINPFHIKNNYVEDIKVQDDFLRPKDSNQE
jgi:hypothetical protein